MDILYIVGRGSRKNNIELRCSLRSICKYGRNVGRVIVAGTPPDWLSKEVVQVCVQDRYPYKHSNIVRCIENVVDKGLLEGDFLYSSDDHFYCRETDFDKYPVYLKSDELLAKVNTDDKFFKYHKSLVDTRTNLAKNGYAFANYSQHCNTHMNADVIRSCRGLTAETYKLHFGVEPTSFFMNIWQSRGDAPKPIPRSDLKIGKPMNLEQLREATKGSECFSIGDGIFAGSAFQEFYQSEFPEKCRYEM